MTRKIIESIANKDYVEAKKAISEKLTTLAEQKKLEVKKMIAARLHEDEETLDEATRIKIVRARIRNGKIQRRKKVSNVPGMTLRSGRLTRMSPTERRNRKLGQRRGKLKRRAKKSQMLRRRKLSLMKRSRLGL